MRTQAARARRTARYPDIANPDVLDRVPLSARHVLDVGCGTASLARELRRRNPRVRLSGVEIDAEAASLAYVRLDRLYIGDLDRDPVPFAHDIPAEGYDCLVYGDVLEHLRDPWSVLREQAASLAPDGVVVICIPNLEHWSFVERLLRGTWRYEDEGLFDRTHLRWFTLDTMRATLAAAGLEAVDVAPRRFDAAGADAFARALQPALERLGVDPGSYLAHSAPLQHVWRAQRRPASLIFVAATMLEKVGGVSDVRVSEPMHALLGEPGVIPRVTPLEDLPETLPGMPRIAVLHRPALVGEGGLDILRRLVRRGWLVVTEFDDHPDYMPALQRPEVHSFDAVHAVQTSTEALASVLREKNPEVAVFPNAVARLQEPRNHADPARQTLFFGGLNRAADWPALLPGLNGAAARAGERLRFRIVADRALFDALETPHKEFHPLCDYETYQNLLATSEMSFMPLADTPFNRCKSDLKFIEAASFRVAAIASDVVYGGSVRDGRTGLLFRDAAELQQRILRLVASPELGRTIGDAARTYVAAERMLAYQTARRSAWYRSLWLRRDELHAAALARVPGLAAPLAQV